VNPDFLLWKYVGPKANKNIKKTFFVLFIIFICILVYFNYYWCLF